MRPTALIRVALIGSVLTAASASAKAPSPPAANAAKANSEQTVAPAAKSAPADDPAATKVRHEEFDLLDANKDGVVTKQEAAKYPQVLYGFDKLDTDKDGKLSRAEYIKHS